MNFMLWNANCYRYSAWSVAKPNLAKEISGQKKGANHDQKNRGTMPADSDPRNPQLYGGLRYDSRMVAYDGARKNR